MAKYWDEKLLRGHLDMKKHTLLTAMKSDLSAEQPKPKKKKSNSPNEIDPVESLKFFFNKKMTEILSGAKVLMVGHVEFSSEVIELNGGSVTKSITDATHVLSHYTWFSLLSTRVLKCAERGVPIVRAEYFARSIEEGGLVDLSDSVNQKYILMKPLKRKTEGPLKGAVFFLFRHWLDLLVRDIPACALLEAIYHYGGCVVGSIKERVTHMIGGPDDLLDSQLTQSAKQNVKFVNFGFFNACVTKGSLLTNIDDCYRDFKFRNHEEDIKELVLPFLPQNHNCFAGITFIPSNGEFEESLQTDIMKHGGSISHSCISEQEQYVVATNSADFSVNLREAFDKDIKIVGEGFIKNCITNGQLLDLSIRAHEREFEIGIHELKGMFNDNQKFIQWWYKHDADSSSNTDTDSDSNSNSNPDTDTNSARL